MTINCIIINYRKAPRCIQCIDSLLAQSSGHLIRLFVLDNSCSDQEYGLLKTRAGVRCVVEKADDNIGYTRGVNRVFSGCSDPQFTVLISPDVILHDPSTLDHMARLFVERPNLGILASVQTNDDGSIAEVARRYPSPLDLVRRRLCGKNSDMDLNLAAMRGGRDRIDEVD